MREHRVSRPRSVQATPSGCTEALAPHPTKAFHDRLVVGRRFCGLFTWRLGAKPQDRIIWSGGDRQPDRRDCASRLTAGEFDRAAVALDDAAGQGKPEPQA